MFWSTLHIHIFCCVIDTDVFYVYNIDVLMLPSVYLCVCTGIKACMKVMQIVDEEPYEITVDIHGIRDGPRLGRLRLLNQVGCFLP